MKLDEADVVHDVRPTVAVADGVKKLKCLAVFNQRVVIETFVVLRKADPLECRRLAFAVAGATVIRAG